MVYVIDTQPKGFHVERRYNEFVTFRAELMRLYPGYIVPPIPHKKTGKALEPTFISKRKELLQLFLSDLLKHPLLRTAELLFNFLSLPTKDWEVKINVLAKMQPPKEPKECRTPEKRANVELTKASELYCVDLLNGVETLQSQYKEYCRRLTRA